MGSILMGDGQFIRENQSTIIQIQREQLCNWEKCNGSEKSIQVAVMLLAKVGGEEGK